GTAVNFDIAGGAGVKFNNINGAAPVNGVLGFATANGDNWAQVTSGVISALSTFANDDWSNGANTNVTVSQNAVIDGSHGNPNTINFRTAGAITVTNPGALTTNGIMITPTVA